MENCIFLIQKKTNSIFIFHSTLQNTFIRTYIYSIQENSLESTDIFRCCPLPHSIHAFSLNILPEIKSFSKNRLPAHIIILFLYIFPIYCTCSWTRFQLSSISKNLLPASYSIPVFVFPSQLQSPDTLNDCNYLQFQEAILSIFSLKWNVMSQIWSDYADVYVCLCISYLFYCSRAECGNDGVSQKQEEVSKNDKA